jgi:acyl-CoA dehydrogenase
MDFDTSSKVQALQEKLWSFMHENVFPNESVLYKEVEANRKNGNPWVPTNIMEELKQKARKQGLWNLFLPHADGAGLTNLEYAPLCEIMGRSLMASEVFNCSAPDTGNMEVLAVYGSAEQKEKWLKPLLDGKIRSAFSMTEPMVGSSDATNIQSEIRRDGNTYVINGTKWWTSGGLDPRCKILIFMGKTDPNASEIHKQQSMVLVPTDTPGVTIERHTTVFGYDDAPHGHAVMSFKNVVIPAENILLGEGRGFEISQGRLGPGRIHCMRLIGLAERALENLCKRSMSRHMFGKLLSDQGVTRERIAESRILIDQARLLVLNAADKMDKLGNKEARKEIAMIKVAAPAMACQVIDWAIQVHGAGGVSGDFDLAYAYAGARSLRLADGPDEVHRDQIARLELSRYKER